MSGSQSPDRSPPSRCEEDSDSDSCTVAGSQQGQYQHDSIDWTDRTATNTMQWAPESVATGTPETRQQTPSDTSVPTQNSADTDERAEPSNSRQMSVNNLLNASHSPVVDQQSAEQPRQAGMAPTNNTRQSAPGDVCETGLAEYQMELMLQEQERVRMLMKRKAEAREEQERLGGATGGVNDAHLDGNAMQTRSEDLQSNKRQKICLGLMRLLNADFGTASHSSAEALPRGSLSKMSVDEGMVANQNVDKSSTASRQNEQENVQSPLNLAAKMLPSKPEHWFIPHSSMESFIRPGDVLVSTGFDNLETYLATSRAHPMHEGPCTWRWGVEAWTYRFDGSGGLRREEKMLYLEYRAKSAGEKLCFGSLGFAPLRLFGESFHQYSREEGRLIWQCRERRLVSYVDEKGERFMVDFKAYNDIHPNTDSLDKPKSLFTSKLTGVDFWRDQPPAEPDLLLLPHKLVGFGFRTNKWRHLQAKHIRLDVGWNDRAFASLIADANTKKGIESLALAQSSVNCTTDMPIDEGNSLLMLFRGDPGTGKTCTAEATAEMIRKPLYRVTGGDIRTGPRQFKEKLDSVFKLARLWGCIVLLEDADIFLTQCKEDDRHRKALASIFVHALDHHDGIVILTSPSSATFDGAIKSRVRLTVQHGPLIKSWRKEHWRGIFDQEGAKRDSIINSHELLPHLDALSEFVLDGRQIRYSVHTARQLAIYQSETVDFGHLMRGIQITTGLLQPEVS